MNRTKALVRVILARLVNVVLMFAILLPIKQYVSTPGSAAPWWAWGVALSLYPAYALQALAFHVWVDRRPLREFPLRWDRPARKAALWGSLISAAMLLGFVGITQLTGMASWHWNSGFNPTWTVMTALLLLQAGLGEEFFDRGYIIPTLGSFGPVWSALIGTTLFTLSHMITGRVNPLELVAIFVHGLFYVYLARKSGSLWPVVIIHGVYDPLTSLIWANGKFTSLLLFDGDVLWFKWVWKALIMVPWLLMVWFIYRKNEGREAKQAA